MQVPTAAIPTTEHTDMIMQPVLREKKQQQLLTRILVPCNLKQKYILYHSLICTIVNSKPKITQILGSDAVGPVTSVLTS
jgi:predicted transcriptional regulator